MKYGIQMYSLRDIVKTDFDMALKAVAEMGYELIEFDEFFGNSAEVVKEMLDKYSLEVSGSHVEMKDIRDRFDETVAFHKTIGNSRFIIPYAATNTREKLEEFIDFLNEYAPRLKSEGIELGFHNHASEFIPTEEGYIPHEELQRRTDIFFELDTYWTYVAHLDPVDTLERLRDRVRVIHLKDGDLEGNGRSLGMGTAPVAAVKAKAEELGIDIVVESEGCDPSGIEEVRRCIEYLHKLDSQKY